MVEASVSGAHATPKTLAWTNHDTQAAGFLPKALDSTRTRATSHRRRPKILRTAVNRYRKALLPAPFLIATPTLTCSRIAPAFTNDCHSEASPTPSLDPNISRACLLPNRQHVGRSVVVPLRCRHKCREPLPPSLLYYHVQRSRMVRPSPSDLSAPFLTANSDYINPIDLCNRLNTYIIPEAAVHGFLTFMFLINGYWLPLILNLPLLGWNINKYVTRT